jgi:uncharacterized protein (DUF302 family)
MPAIAVTRRVPMTYREAVDRIKAELAGEGFGILTEIDVKATLKEKLNVDFRDYVIIGACNPSLAHRALEADLGIGALLPCNVVVYADGDESVVSVFDPEVGMALAESPALAPIAREAKARLLRALDRV